jgi:integrase
MTVLLDAAGRRRSPATLPGYHAGRPPRNKGMRYPADPPTIDEIVAVMRHTADDRHGWRLRAMIVVLWRAGLRIHEALALAEHDLDSRRGSLLVRHGKGGRGREVGMDEWGWEQLRPWLDARAELPVGPLFCIIDGPTRGRPWSGAAVRGDLRRLAAEAGVRRRFAPHQLRHAHALELAREGVPLRGGADAARSGRRAVAQVESAARLRERKRALPPRARAHRARRACGAERRRHREPARWRSGDRALAAIPPPRRAAGEPGVSQAARLRRAVCLLPPPRPVRARRRLGHRRSSVALTPVNRLQT